MKLPLHLPLPPRLLICTLLLVGVTSVVPLTMFVMHATSFHEKPRIHLFQDMDNQVRYNAQQGSVLFADGRAMRPDVPGTVGRGQLDSDDHLVRGFELREVPATEENPSGLETEYFDGFPEQITIDRLFVDHGRERYDAMCSLCHGLDGRGNGPVHQRSQQLMTSGRGIGTVWAAPANLLKVEDGQLAYGPELYPAGELYNTIANGKGNMTGYAHAMPIRDRWAVVAYIRALQNAQKEAVLEETATEPEAGRDDTAAPSGTAPAGGRPPAGTGDPGA